MARRRIDVNLETGCLVAPLNGAYPHVRISLTREARGGMVFVVQRSVYRRIVAVVRLLLAALLTFSSVPLSAQPQPPAAEHEVKAAYLYQFGRYVEWPSDQERASSSFVICVLGEDPFGLALDEIVKGKIISGHPVAIRRILGPSELQDCRILFVNRSEDDRLPAILKALEGRMVLTVGEGTQFTRRGGMVAFTSEDKKVRFIVNLTAAEAAKVKLSSQLLRVAVSVEQ